MLRLDFSPLSNTYNKTELAVSDLGISSIYLPLSIGPVVVSFLPSLLILGLKRGHSFFVEVPLTSIFLKDEINDYFVKVVEGYEILHRDLK